MTLQRWDEAMPLFARGIAVLKAAASEQRATAALKNAAAWELLTCEPDDLRDSETALGIALAACEATGFQNANYLDTLALAYHLTGDTAKAVETMERALSPVSEGDARSRAEFEKRRSEYEAAPDEPEQPFLVFSLAQASQEIEVPSDQSFLLVAGRAFELALSAKRAVFGIV